MAGRPTRTQLLRPTRTQLDFVYESWPSGNRVRPTPGPAILSDQVPTRPGRPHPARPPGPLPSVRPPAPHPRRTDLLLVTDHRPRTTSKAEAPPAGPAGDGRVGPGWRPGGPGGPRCGPSVPAPRVRQGRARLVGAEIGLDQEQFESVRCVGRPSRECDPAWRSRPGRSLIARIDRVVESALGTRCPRSIPRDVRGA
jgi:hypothetical protein